MSTPDANTPADETGDGPVTIEDRVEPGGEGSPGSNQAKTEPMSPTGTHAEPMAPPDLDDMNVGAGDPQAPRHPAALRSETSATGAYADAPADSTAGESPGQGDDAGVPSTGTAPLEGSSEEHRTVAGVRPPDESQ